MRPNLFNCSILLLGIMIAFRSVDAHDPTHPLTKLSYIANAGQWPEQVLYKADVPGAVAFLEKDGITWVKYDAAIYEWMHDEHMFTVEEKNSKTWNGHAWRMDFVDGNANMNVFPRERSSAYHNYFLGNDRSKWAGHVPLYSEVFYDEVWPGVDLKFHSGSGSMKYDIVIEAWADPSLIGFRYGSVDGLSVGENGELMIATTVGELIEMAPMTFYADGARERISCKFVVIDDEVRFEFPEGYNALRPVVIDPVIIASTLSGSTGASNYGHCGTYDGYGNIYTGARNFGPGYPVTLGAFQQAFGGGGPTWTTDMVFSKYNSDGSALIYATYLGGSNTENPHSMIVSQAGELCVLGTTSSSDFPITINAFGDSLQIGGNVQEDIVITRFSSNGSSLIGSTYIGGSGTDGLNQMYANYGEAFRGEIILDEADNIVVASCSSSNDFPITPGASQPSNAGQQDGILFSISPDCSTLNWSTYFGGTGDDVALGIHLDGDSVLVITGYTVSADLPVTAGAYQTVLQGAQNGFIARFQADGTNLLRSTYFGPSDVVRSYFLDLDQVGDVWIYGQNFGNIPIQPQGTWGETGGSIFLAKFDPLLSIASITTTLDTGYAFVPIAFGLDPSDNIYISAFYASTGLPLTADAFYTSGAFYAASFAPNMGDLEFASYFSGSHVDGGTSRFDECGTLYQGVCTAIGTYETVPWAFDTIADTSWDIAVFKVDFQLAGCIILNAGMVTDGSLSLRIWPNPIDVQGMSNSGLSISLPQEQSKDLEVLVFAADGRIVHRSSVTNREGTTLHTDPIELAPGIYSMQLMTSVGRKHHTKFVVQ